MSVNTIPAPTARKFDPVTALALGATILGWASAFAAIRVGLTAFGPLELGSLRFTIAAVPCALLIAVLRPAMPCALLIAVLRPAMPTLREWVRIAARGFVCVALYTVLLNLAERTISSGPASFIVNVAPILTALWAMALLGERFSTVAWIGTALSFAGVGLVAISDDHGFTFNIGAVFAIGAAFCTSVDAVIQKPLFHRHRPLVVSAWSMLFSALFLTPGLPSAIAQFQAAPIDARIAVIYLGIVPSFIAYGAWSVTVSRFPASRAANFLYCIPPTATLMGFLWLREVPNWLGILGGAMALAGVVTVNLAKSRRKVG